VVVSESEERTPHVVVIGRPNGAGKSTVAPLVLTGALGVTEFVNADVIAHGLSAFQPERQAIQAGRIMLARLKELAAAREDFAFETTLASRSFAPWIKELCGTGYAFHLVFVWLADADLAVRRVGARVRSGGHQVPEETVRRRYNRGVTNFFELYKPLAVTWRVYNNTADTGPRLVASQDEDGLGLGQPADWEAMERLYEHAKHDRD
jgi:predicted ABC-type ATPase